MKIIIVAIIIFFGILVANTYCQTKDAIFSPYTLHSAWIGSENETPDTVKIDTIKGFEHVYLMVVDTGATYTDSVVVEAWNPSLSAWIPVPMICPAVSLSTIYGSSSRANKTTEYYLLIKGLKRIRARLDNGKQEYSGNGYVSNRNVIIQFNMFNY